MGCGESEYRCLKVDANVNRVLPRVVAQAVKGSNDTRFYGVGSGDVGKELPRNKSVVCVLLGASLPCALLVTFPACLCSVGTFKGQPL